MPTTTSNEPDSKPLCLQVMDDEDLAVVSALLQDADASLAEMAYLPTQSRFALVLSRFDWPASRQGRFERRQTGIHFDRVLKVARSGLDAGRRDAPLRLLAIAFRPGEAPGGSVHLTFLDGAQIRLDVECLDAEMRDMGPRWTVAAPPPPVGDVPSPESRP